MKPPVLAITKSKTRGHNRRELLHNCLTVSIVGILLDHNLTQSPPESTSAQTTVNPFQSTSDYWPLRQDNLLFSFSLGSDHGLLWHWAQAFKLHCSAVSKWMMPGFFKHLQLFL